MRRRRLLKAGTARIGAAVAGCLGLSAPGDEHPLAGRTQTVRALDAEESIIEIEAEPPER